MLAGKRVLVTGGAGFLGSHLCERLLATGADVLCVDNFFSSTRHNIAHLLDDKRFELPRPLKGKPGCDFSFSGLKNAVRLLIQGQTDLSEQVRNDIAACFQRTVAEHIADRASKALKDFADRHPGPNHLVVAGGVAANSLLREKLRIMAEGHGFTLTAPPLRLCTDNAAMIAWAGLERFRLGHTDGLDFAPRPRWPLDPGAKR